MNVYHFIPETGELLNQTQARSCPRGGGHLIPANATATAPPETGNNQCAVFDAEAGTWDLVPDFRGTQYWDEDGNRHVIVALNVEIPAGSAPTAPPEEMEAPFWGGSQWLETAELEPEWKRNRRKAILDQFPVHDQLEAITENEDNRPEKLTALLSHIQDVKTQFPKPE